MKIILNTERKLSDVSPLIYGQFAEHFHRQIYGGIFDPHSDLSDEDGFRMDVIDALKQIHVPIIRWPGGCFVSAYHWKDGVGPERRPAFDKAWRVEEPNLFGTDEFIRFCRKVGQAMSSGFTFWNSILTGLKAGWPWRRMWKRTCSPWHLSVRR